MDMSYDFCPTAFWTVTPYLGYRHGLKIADLQSTSDHSMHVRTINSFTDFQSMVMHFIRPGRYLI